MQPTNGAFSREPAKAKERFSEIVTAIVRQDRLDAEKRNKIVEALCNAYISQMGEPPPANELERLANYILKAAPDPNRRGRHQIFNDARERRLSKRHTQFSE